MRPRLVWTICAAVLTLATGCDRMGSYERELEAVRAAEAAGARPLPAHRDILAPPGDSFETIAAGLAGPESAPAVSTPILVEPDSEIPAVPVSP